MKRNFLFMSVLASLLFVGCSQDEIAPNEEDVGNGEANTSYISVNLMSSDITGTRAQSGYEDGSEVENSVEKVRFYFFNSTGGAVNVKLLNGSYVNYYDWEPQEGDQTDGTDENDDIESKLKATIVINTSGGDKIPQRIAAVLNPPTIDDSPLLPAESMGLTTLKGKVADFATAGLTQKNKFVMFNSVYKSDGAQVSTALIESKHLCKTEDEAKDNPVTIYVERSVAKVKVTLDEKAGFDANYKLKLKGTDNNDITVDGQAVYLKLEGWSLTAETSEGRLVKKIDPEWPGTWWNNPHRSFWAINSMTAENRYYDYRAIKTAFGNDYALYTNENAQTNDLDDTEGKAKNKTKFILKGTLQKADGSSFTIVRHLGSYFADDGNQTKLRESILGQLNASGNTYFYLNEDGKGRTQITKDDIEIKVVPQQENENSKNNCYVYAQLTSTAAAKTWYTTKEESATPIENAATTINGKLADNKIVDRALVWNSGMTYYYNEIKHLTESSQTGVVRNHIYAINVTKIAGLGTPVYDPDQTIYPEKPDPNDHYIAARINILSWRLVKNDYELKW